MNKKGNDKMHVCSWLIYHSLWTGFQRWKSKQFFISVVHRDHWFHDMDYFVHKWEMGNFLRSTWWWCGAKPEQKFTRRFGSEPTSIVVQRMVFFFWCRQVKCVISPACKRSFNLEQFTVFPHLLQCRRIFHRRNRGKVLSKQLVKCHFMPSNWDCKTSPWFMIF